MSPSISCLNVKPINCNGGVLEIYNTCKDIATIGNIMLPTKEYLYVEIVKNSTTEAYQVVQVRGISVFLPSQKTKLKATGTVGNQSFTISYVKTGPLCS